MKPVCVGCQRFYRPKKNGFAFIEGKPKFDRAEPGLSEPHLWEPYKLWMGDKWECRGCGSEIVIGAGLRPVTEHYQPDFQAKITSYNAMLQVNDC